MRPKVKVDLVGQMTTLSKWHQIKSRSYPQYLGAYPGLKILKNVSIRGQRPEAKNSDIGEIKKEGWSSHLWSEFDGNCIFFDGLGAIWKIFIQLWPLASFGWSEWISFKYHLNHPQICNSRQILTANDCSSLLSLFY